MTRRVRAPGTAERSYPTVTPRPGASTTCCTGCPALSPLIVLVLACIVFGLANGRFFKPENLSIVLQQAAVVGSLAVGQTLIILTAGIDLSIGAVMVLASARHGQARVRNGVAGLPRAPRRLRRRDRSPRTLNGVLVTRLKLPPFIVTLGTLSIFTALTADLRPGPDDHARPRHVPHWTGKTIGVGRFNITVGVLMMLLLYAGFAYALRQTAWGRHLYATGDDAEAARLAGIRTNRVLLVRLRRRRRGRRPHGLDPGRPDQRRRPERGAQRSTSRASPPSSSAAPASSAAAAR